MLAAKADTYIMDFSERMLVGDQEAYREFADEFGPKLRAFFVHNELSPADAEALAVTCVSDAVVKLARYRPVAGATFGAWVFGIARHAVAEWRRSRSRTVQLSDDMPVQTLFGGDLEQDMEVDLAVRKGLAKLPVPDREIIRLRHFGEERDYGEIAALLGTRPGAARVRHLRALRRLERVLLQDRCIRQRLERGKRREARQSE
jgi:RNA polymerase sigma-70 factor (ECF subfamily)